MHIVNLQNFDLDNSNLQRLRAATGVFSKHGEIVLMAGDYNLGTEEAATLTTDDAGSTFASGHDRERRRWDCHLPSLCALTHDQPTHAAMEYTSFGRGRIRHSSLDRIATNMSPPTIARADITIRPADIRLAIPRQGRTPLSDHIPVSFKPWTASPPHHLRTIPTWLIRTPQFAEHVAKACNALRDKDLPPHDMWRRRKQAIRNAARAARLDILRRHRATVAGRCQLALQLVGAIHANEVDVAQRVPRTWPECHAAVLTTASGVRVTDERCFHRLRGTAIGRARQQAAAAPGPDRKDQGSTRLTQVTSRLSDHDQATWLQTTRPSTSIGRDNSDTTTDVRLAKAFPRAFTPRTDAEPVPLLGRGTIDRVIDHSPNTTPGPDGLPYLAWARAGEGARDILHTLTTELMRADRAPPSLNASLAVFPPTKATGSGPLERRLRPQSSTGATADAQKC